MVCCLVQLHLKGILGHLQTKWHMQELVPAMMHVENGQVQRFLMQVDASLHQAY